MTVDRARTASLVVVLIALSVLQSPGLISADTKLDLVTDPGGLLGRGLQAWAPEGQFGQVQNQAYGYLWPMGPFFWLGEQSGLPDWVVQRLWWALALSVGFVGARRLLGRMGIGGPNSQLVGALVYVLTPRVLGLLGTTSVEAWPSMVLPWVLLPLVTRQAPWKAAALSGAAALLLGGVNAAASLAVLAVPGLWLMTASGLDRRLRRLVAWLAAMMAAVAWWFLPLLSLRTSAFPFLDYIESAQVTTSVTSVTNVLRGAQHWVAYSGTGAGASWTAGAELALRPSLVLATTAVAAAGLAGLAVRGPRVAQQRFFVVSLLVGILIMSTGWYGRFGSPVAEQVRFLLDHPLAPFRNVHKFDVLVRLPVAVGLAHLIAQRHALPAMLGLRSHPRWLLTAMGTAAAVVGLAAVGPLFGGRAASRGSFDAIPTYWTQTAAWLDQNVGAGRAMVLPASNFGEYTWGRPLDEPLTSLMGRSWVVRNAVPLGAPGAIRWMDGIDALVRTGRGSPDLAPALAAAGVTHLVLRNDLDVGVGLTPAPVVRAAVVGSQGMRRVAGFGPLAGTFFDTQAVTGAFVPSQVEVFAVEGSGGAELVPNPMVVSGGPEASVTHGLAAAGLTPWVAAADMPATSGTGISTDSLVRRSQNFGAERGRDMTPTLSNDDDALRGRPAADVSPFSASTPRPTSRLVGPVISVTASSSRADPFESAYIGPDARPFLAVDGDPQTAWQASPLDAQPELRLALAAPVSRVEIAMAGQTAGGSIRSVRAMGATGESSAQVDAEGRATLVLPGPSAQWTFVIDRRGTLPVGIAEVVGIPGATTQVVDLPAGASTGLVLQRMAGGRRPCLDLGLDWACSPQWATGDEEAGSILRTVPGPAPDGVPTLAVSAVAGPELSERLDTALGLEVEASSSEFSDPAARPGAMFDQDPGTAWIPSTQEVNPQVDVVTGEVRTVRSFAFHAAARYVGLAASLVADGRLVAGPLQLGREARFPPVTAGHWRIVFTRQADTPLPLRIREVDLGWEAPDPVVVGCDEGLGVDVDGHRLAYQLRASIGTVLSGSSMQAQPCAASLPAAPRRTTVRTTVSSIDLPWLTVDRISGLPPAEVATRLMVQSPEPGRRIIALPASARGGVVALTEGFNPGWRAQAGGDEVAAVRLEGWRQGWQVPPHEEATNLVMMFEPTGSHRRGLFAGLVLALGLAVAAGLALRSRVESVGTYQERSGARGMLGPVLGILPVAFLAAGPAGLSVAGVLLPVGRRVGWAPLLVGLSVLAAGWTAVGDRLGSGSGGGQLACLAALAAIGGSLADPPHEGLLKSHQGDPRNPDGDDRSRSEPKPELPPEQR